MKNISSSVKTKILSSYLNTNTTKNLPKSTNVNVLLNRVKTNEKNEGRKKIYFSAAASAGLFLFGLIIF
ncbi:hypothetical protein IDG58_00385 [Pelagibacterales bacterium SAG-MED19]|nr:hypothetical protein [Pelagibacterales bacterium SAG-MED19]